MVACSLAPFMKVKAIWSSGIPRTSGSFVESLCFGYTGADETWEMVQAPKLKKIKVAARCEWRISASERR